MSQYLSKRASQRESSHFISGELGPKPEGFKPHPKPMPLHWGMPNAGFFPTESIEVKIVDPFTGSSVSSKETDSTQDESGNSPSTENRVNGDAPTANVSGDTVKIPRHANGENIIDLASGLQYSELEGIPRLRQFTRDFTDRVNKPDYDEWDTILTGGAGDGLNKAADALLDDGDIILLEEFTFTPFLLSLKHVGAIPIPLKLDMDTEAGKSQGLDLDYLTELLENWDELKPDLKGKRPKALYTIPTGQNPTGLTQNLEFRKKVYALAEKYDFAIIEDDPYGYLTLPPYQNPSDSPAAATDLTIDEYLAEHLTPSYLTLDTTGRVVRIETYSKVFGPGLRLGFVVAHKKIIEAIANYAVIVTRSPPGTSQLILQNAIEQSFGGVDGFIKWFLKLRVHYIHRRDVLLYHLFESKAYKDKLFSVIDPRAGMFASVLINFPPGTDIEAKIKLLNWKFAAFGVGVVPGINMAVDKKWSIDRANFIRLTYAPSESTDIIAEAAKRLTNAIEEFFSNGLEF